MTVAEAERRLETIAAFRQQMMDFLDVKRELLELKAYAERDYAMSHFDPNKMESKGQVLTQRYYDARMKISRGLAEATEITDDCGVPSQIQILPPPMIGGYARKFNLYQAAIEEQLPFDFELAPLKIMDVIDQTVFASERLVREIAQAEATKPSALSKAPSAVGRGFSAMFKTDTDKAIIKWAIIVLVLAAILRLFGLPLNKVGELIVQWFAKK
jgi:hypothetical protein